MKMRLRKKGKRNKAKTHGMKIIMRKLGEGVEKRATFSLTK